MADDSWKAIAAVVLLVIAIFVIYYRLRSLRGKRGSTASEDSVRDQAHNAIVTTKAIASSMERSGMRSLEARQLIQKAERAQRSGDSKAAMDYAASARDFLLKEKMRQQQIGDLTKLPTTKTAPVAPEETTKEKLQKELPKNYLQAKFMLSTVQRAIDDRVSEGGDVSEAKKLLSAAQSAFEQKDYDASLMYGVQAKKASEELVIEISGTGGVKSTEVQVEAVTFQCTSCGADLLADDTFCRKCGVKVEPVACPSCGTKPSPGDAFCRKCGVTLI